MKTNFSNTADIEGAISILGFINVLLTGGIGIFGERFGLSKAPDEGDADIFVHISQVQQSGLNELQDNQKVSFDIEEGRNGKNQATNIKLAGS